MSRPFTCTGCATPYPREEAAFEWVAGEQIFTDTCWRCYDKDRPMVVPRLVHDAPHSSWLQNMGSNTKSQRDRSKLSGRKH